MKKLFKILGITLLIILLLLIAIPFLFQNQIKDSVKTYLNNNVNAQIDFNDFSLSLFSSFPQANVELKNLKIINKKPFEGDTLATIKSLSFDMAVKELIKKPGDSPIQVNSIDITDAILSLKSDKYGNNNYNITKEPDSTSIKEKSTNNFKFNIEDYTISNSTISYFDEGSSTFLSLTEFNHSGKGIFSADISEIHTSSQTNVSYSIDSTKYLNNNSVKLDALIDLDFNKNKYTFKENKGFINQLPLEFDGFIKFLENGQEIDINFHNTGSSFKDFLALIPEEYSKNLEHVKTTGIFKVNGSIKGLNTDSTIPHIDISIKSDDASFKYPNLPKSVENITINANIKNDSGIASDTYMNIHDLRFKIDQDVFRTSGAIKNLTKNILVDARIDGTLNLANISKAYPIELENKLSGILKGKLHTVFDMNAIETNAYERTKNNGIVTITDFVFSSSDVVNPIDISKADILFNPGNVKLQTFKATTGKSDIVATGTINNLLGFLFSDKKLQGNFNVNSNTFVVSDFMVEGNTESTKNKSVKPLKIPAFLDCTINADAKTVVYDNLALKDVKGNILINDEQVTIESMTSGLFDGNLALSGNVTTKTDTPVFNLDLGVSNFDISQSFNGLELFQNLAPVAKALQGKFNSTINMKGTLDNEFSPDLNSVSGNAFAELLTTKIELKNAALFDKLKGVISFVDFDKLDLKDLKTKLSFENGTVMVKPFQLKYNDIEISVNGSHSFDKTMNYKAVFNVPAKYLGNEVNNLISKIDDKSVNNITIPVTATIGGSFTSPNVSTNLSSAITNLTQKLIEIQKHKLLNQGKDKIKDVLVDILDNKTNERDSSSTKSSNTIKDILNEVKSGNQDQKDSTSKQSPNQIKGILGRIIDSKKKNQDSVN